MQLSHADVASVQADEPLFRKLVWRVMPFLLICYLFAYLDRVNVAFAKLQMAQQLQFSEAVYGLGAGIFFIGYFLFEVPSNLIMERVGARRWIARIMLTWGMLSAGMMLVTTANQFYVMRFLLGVAEAGFFPGVLLYLSQWFPSVQRGRVVALLMAAVPVSTVIGAPISGWILQSMQGVQGLGGWQWLFLIEGVPSMILGVACLFLLTDRIAEATWLTPQEKRHLQMQLDLDDKGKQTHSFKAALASPRLWLLAAIYFCIALGNLGLAFWMPTLVKEAGVRSLGTVGLLTAIPYLCATVVMILVGRSADARRERRYHLAVPMLTGALGLIAAAHMPNLSLTMVALVVATAGLTTALPMYWPVPSAILGGSAMAGGLALLNSAGALAGFVGPFGIGWLKTHAAHPNLALYVMAAIVAAGAAAVLGLRANEVNR
ncbi:MFS transporter [Massilia niastensis]|uniref:MFS transporter n=1 Tax=Massilia niastensis TaxID=544911 RepID=UPI000476252E|nr:MFS transporter [Massilia niastensis]